MEKETKIEDKIEEVKEEKTEQASDEKVEEKVEAKKERCCKLGICKTGKCKNKGLVLAILVLVLLVAGSYAFNQYRQKNDVGSKVIKSKVEKFVSENVPEGTKTEVQEPTIDGQLYKAIVKLDGQEIPVYVTKDGKKLIQAQGVIELDKQPSDNKKAAQSPEKAEAEQKTDVPTVDLFVMSFCPYGTQIEKGMLPVLETLGSKIKFNLKFVDYAMHGPTEIEENLRQYCIQKTQQPKLDNYLKCFLAKGQGTSEACMKTAGVNVAQINTCVGETDKKFAVNELAKDKSKWENSQFPPFNVDKEDNDKFGVQGSPTLVINGTTISAGRDSASLLKAVCSGFANQPKECEKKLSAEAPAPGFGEGNATGNAGAGAACGAQ